ncbi:MAG: DUF2818 family protein, partial [Candidatus Nitrosotenuis sp.]
FNATNVDGDLCICYWHKFAINQKLMVHNVLLLLMLVLANTSCLTQRVLFLYQPKNLPKSIYWCLLELVAYYFVFLAITFYAERLTLGQGIVQGWEFYSVTASVFIVSAFPGFVYKFLLK